MSIIVFKSHSSKAKHDSIAVDGYCFRFNRSHVRNYAQEFRCCDDKCGARVLFNSPEDFVVLRDHATCEFDHKKELRSRKRLDKAFDVLQKNLTDPPHKIVEKVQLLIDDEMTQDEKRALRTFITRKRTELLGRQSNDANDLVIPDHLRVTATPVGPEHPDNSFLLFDSNEHEQDAPSRILIFVSSDMRFKASLATELFADGTYRIVPNGFATLYTIHSIVGGVPYPIFFCLMQNEREETFMRVLAVVRPYLKTFDVNGVVHTDCQKSAINAFKRTFGCRVKLCLFHINQALWRYVSKVGLAHGYNDTRNPRLHAWIRRLMAFPFMKRERMAVCFHECFEEMAMDGVLGVEEEFRERFRAVVAYYKRFWVDDIGLDMVCQFGEVNRTNNHAEAFHRGVGCAVQVAHPQTLVLIQLLVNVEREAMLRFNNQRVGKNTKPSDRRFDELEKSIANAMKSYNDGLFSNDVEYLSVVVKLYVEYNHKIKVERIRNNNGHLRRVVDLKNAVLKALDDQNFVIFDVEDAMRCGDDGDPSFIGADFNSEIQFDSVHDNCVDERRVNAHFEYSIIQASGAPMELCSEGNLTKPPRDVTKPRQEDDTHQKRMRKRKRKTLLQRMKMKR